MVNNYISEEQNSEIMLLLENELQLTKFLKDRAADAVFWVKPNAKIIYVNNAACNLLGYSREELLSMNIQDLNLEFLLEVWSKHSKNIQLKGFQHFESICWTNKGQSLSLEITITYIEYETKEYSCISICNINKCQEFSFPLQKVNKVLKCKTQELLTKEKHIYEQLSREIIERNWVETELQNSLSLLQATLESSPDGVIAVRSNGDIVTLNQKFVKMWQVPDSIVISRNYKQYLNFYTNQLKEPESFCRNIEQLEIDTQRDFKGSKILELKDGRIFEQYREPLRLGEQKIGMVYSFRDITQRQQAQAEVCQILKQEKQVAVPAASEIAKSLNLELIFPADSYLNQVFKYIEANYHQPISLQDVAVAVGYCPAYLTDLVRRHTGQTVNHWIVERRMVAARSLLLEGNLCVNQIAEIVGYQHEGHFFRQFRQHHGTTPQAWRKAQRIQHNS